MCFVDSVAEFKSKVSMLVGSEELRYARERVNE
jgi:hypothetical protein